MARWLFKTEPSTYSFDDLSREKKTTWEGVKNPTALIHLRSMRKGDGVIIYHTGGERAAVGYASVISNPYADPTAKNDKIVVVDVKAGKRFANPVTLDQIKADKAFAGFDLVRIGRLSIVPVPDAMWRRIEQLAKSASSS
ncbi:MAG: EVE domain-containing protein [Anaerolineae bacterium]|nr:EVE domain-containing protein [Phycisphaerae bacterium]